MQIVNCPSFDSSYMNAFVKHLKGQLMGRQRCDICSLLFCQNGADSQTLPKAQRTHGWPSFNKITAFKSCSQVGQISASKVQNLDHTSGSKFWSIFHHKISTKQRPQTTSNFEAFKILTKPQPRYLERQNLYQNIANPFLIIKISNSNDINKFWVGIFTSIKSTKQQLH